MEYIPTKEELKKEMRLNIRNIKRSKSDAYNKGKEAIKRLRSRN